MTRVRLLEIIFALFVIGLVLLLSWWAFRTDKFLPGNFASPSPSPSVSISSSMSPGIE